MPSKNHKNVKRQKGRNQQSKAPNSRPSNSSAVSTSTQRGFRGLLTTRLSLIWKFLGTTKGIGVLALVLGIVPTVYGVLSYYHTRNADDREGKLGGQLILSMGKGGPSLNQSAPTYFLFAMPTVGEDAKYLIPVPINLTNTSNVRDAQVNLALTYERKYLRSALPAEAMKPSPSRQADEQHFEISTSDSHDYAKYRLTFLSQHDSQSFTEAAIATKIPYDPQAPMLFSSGIGMDLIASTYSERDKRREWEIHFRGLRVKDQASLSAVVQDWYAKQIAFEIRRNAGFWAYIPRLIFQEDVVVYAYAPEFHFFPNLNLFMPKDMPKQYSAYRFKPYDWSLLFDPV